MPQRKALLVNPFVECYVCEIPISKSSVGCLHCKLFSCAHTTCSFCRERYVKCAQHKCSVPAVKRWREMLSCGLAWGTKSNFNSLFGINYSRTKILESRNRLCLEAIFGSMSLFMFIYMIDPETDEFYPDIANGTDIFMFVSKYSCKIKDSDLLYANYGIAGNPQVRGKWIKSSQTGNSLLVDDEWIPI